MTVDLHILWLPSCWPIINRFRDSYIIVLLDLEPGGLKKATAWQGLFCCSMKKDGDSNFPFAPWGTQKKSSLFVILEKAGQSSKVAHSGGQVVQKPSRLCLPGLPR